MCHSIRIDKEKKLAEITATGTVNFTELKEIFMETVGHDDWQAGFNMLCDYRKIDNFDVISRDIENITESGCFSSLVSDFGCPNIS